MKAKSANIGRGKIQSGASAAMRPRASVAAKQNSRIEIRIPWQVVMGVVIALVIATVIAFGGQLALDMLRKPITKVSVAGQFIHQDRKQVQQVLSGFTEAGFYQIDLDELKRVLEAMPWVFQARVGRVWPDALSVEIIEQNPVLQWNDNAFLNAAGDRFEPEIMVAIASIPKLIAADGQETKTREAFLWLNSQFLSWNLHIAELEFDRKNALSLKLKSGTLIKFGSGDLEEKLIRFSTVFNSGLAAKMEQVERIDLRYANGVAVAWKQQR